MPSKLEQSTLIPSCDAPALVADLGSRVAVIVTHPWGPLGGSMHNNVVAAVVLFFQKLGVTTLRFNFVGLQIGRGNRQVKQVEDAANFLLEGKHIQEQQATESAQTQTRPPSYILLVGYSYGSLITGSATAKIPRCIGFISIAPPISVGHWLTLFNANYHLEQARKRTSLPRLMVIGAQDNFTSEDIFMDTVASFPSESTTGAILKEADHFFAHREKDLMAIVSQWLLTAYPACNNDVHNFAQLELHMYTELETLYQPKQSGASSAGVEPLFTCSGFEAGCRD